MGGTQTKVMGAACSRVAGWVWYWSDESKAQRARGTVDGALAVLRTAARETAANIAAKQRRIRDYDRAIMEIGLRWRAARSRRTETVPGGGGNLGPAPPLGEVERAALKHEMRKRRLCVVRTERLYGVLGNIEEQVALLEDSAMLCSSVAAMRHGARAQQQAGGMLRPEDVEDILDRVAEQQQLASDTAQLLADQQRVTEQMQGIDQQGVEDELAALMNSPEFTGQFDAEEVARAQQAIGQALAGPPPPDDPLVVMAERRAHQEHQLRVAADLALLY